MQSASLMSMKYASKNFRVKSCDSGNLRVVSYNWTILWVASYELIIRLWVGSRISLHYIKSALLVYIISGLQVKQSPSRHTTSSGRLLMILFCSWHPGPYKDRNRIYEVFTLLWQCDVWYSVGIRKNGKNFIKTHFIDCG